MGTTLLRSAQKPSWCCSWLPGWLTQAKEPKLTSQVCCLCSAAAAIVAAIAASAPASALHVLQLLPRVQQHCQLERDAQGAEYHGKTAPVLLLARTLHKSHHSEHRGILWGQVLALNNNSHNHDHGSVNHTTSDCDNSDHLVGCGLNCMKCAESRLHGLAGLFERAVALDKSWEKGYFSYAVYLDQLMRDARQRQTAPTASRSSAKAMDRLGGRSRYPHCVCILTITYLVLSS